MLHSWTKIHAISCKEYAWMHIFVDISNNCGQLASETQPSCWVYGFWATYVPDLHL